MVTRANLPQRFRIKDEIFGARFNAAGTWNFTSAAPIGSDAQYSIAPLSEMSLDGQPVLKVSLSDNCSQFTVGVTTGKTFTLPNDWNREFAVVYNVPDKYESINNVTLSCGDVAITAATSFNKTIVMGGPSPGGPPATGSTIWHHNGWRTHRIRSQGSLDVPTPPVPGVTAQTTVAGRVKFTKNSGPGTACVVYIAWMGVPAKQRPQVMLTFDHGTIGQCSLLWPEAKKRGIPIVIGMQSQPVVDGAATHMTAQNIRDMNSDPSGLAEFYSYSRDYVKTAIATPVVPDLTQRLTLDQFLADYDTCASFLAGLGVKEPTLYHPYPYGDYTDALMKGIWARGCRLARRVDAAGARTNDTANCFTGQQQLSFDQTFGPSVANNPALFIQGLKDSISAGEHFVSICHDVLTAGDTTHSGWPIDYWITVLDYLVFARNQGLIDIVGAKEFVYKLTNPRYAV